MQRFPKMGVMGATWYIFDFPKGIFPNCIFTISFFLQTVYSKLYEFIIREISQIWMGLVQETMSHLEMFIFTQTGNIALVTINTCGGPNICSHYCWMGAHTWYTTPANLTKFRNLPQEAVNLQYSGPWILNFYHLYS